MELSGRRSRAYEEVDYLDMQMQLVSGTTMENVFARIACAMPYMSKLAYLWQFGRDAAFKT